MFWIFSNGFPFHWTNNTAATIIQLKQTKRTKRTTLENHTIFPIPFCQQQRA